VSIPGGNNEQSKVAVSFDVDSVTFYISYVVNAANWCGEVYDFA